MEDVAAPEADSKAAEAAAAAQETAKAAPQAEAAEQKDTGTAPEQQETPQVTFKVARNVNRIAVCLLSLQSSSISLQRALPHCNLGFCAVGEPCAALLLIVHVCST
jgi:hypothetical protein